MTQIILFNGPPGSGKDTAAKYLQREYGAYHTKFAKALKEATHALYGLGALPDDFFESSKGKATQTFFGLPPRQAYIKVSEELVKPVLGKNFFGEVMRQTCKRAVGDGYDLIVISDSGFAEEALPLVEEFGAENILLVQIHAEERGCTFEGDSRSYISLPAVYTAHIDNNGSEEEFLNTIDWIMEILE